MVAAQIQLPELLAVVLALAAVAVGFAASSLVALARKRNARREAATITDRAQADADEIVRKAEVAAKEELHRRREEFENETRETRTELKLLEKRLVKREDALERKADLTTKREKYIENLEHELSRRQETLAAKERELAEVLDKQKDALYRISGLSPQDARTQLFERLEREFEREAATLLDQKIERAKETAEQEARVVLSAAIQRCAVEHTNESVVSTIDLPGDEMKGRIIGREGRNIRAFEKATGVDVIVDDTPGVVVLSAFDSVRREMARRSMEELVADGRIHPARIEEVVERAKRKTEETILQVGKQTLFDMGVHANSAKLAYLLGRLKYRTSYGQNVLQHSIEVAHLCSIMAAELKLDPVLAKRIGLLHDIGKAVDHELEGGHPEIGALLGKRIDENATVINAIAAHHEGEPPKSIYAVLVQAGRPTRDAREVHPPPRTPRGRGQVVRRGRQRLRHPGRPRGPSDRQERQGRGQGVRQARPRHRQGDRAGARLPWGDPRDGYPGDASRRIRALAERVGIADAFGQASCVSRRPRRRGMRASSVPVQILAIGDIVGRPGRDFLRDRLPGIVARERIDFVIANGENTAGGLGITRTIAAQLHSYGVHVITTGDHVWRRRDIHKALAEDPCLLRPQNYPPGAPGAGVVTVATPRGVPVRVINLLGRVYLDPLDCPFECVTRLLERTAGPPVTIVDFHAEATSEKGAMAWFLDGRVSAVLGTHTHVQTADERLLENGTAFITDLGMTGSQRSVLGRRVEQVVEKFRTRLYVPMDVADDSVQMCGVIVTVDAATGRALGIRRVAEA